jgi:hypothetical protein
LKLREQNLHSWLDLNEENWQALRTRHPGRDTRSRELRTRTRRDRSDVRDHERDF